MGKIRIDKAGHFYLDEYDIGPFVADYKLDGELLVVRLIGDIEMPFEALVADSDNSDEDEEDSE